MADINKLGFKELPYATYMHLSIKKMALKNCLLRVPHRPTPMKVSQIEKEHPEFAKLFDGESMENTIGFYWKKDKMSGIYEFKDAEDEDEVGFISGIGQRQDE